MERQKIVIDNVLAVILGLGSLVVTYIDLVSKIIGLVVALLSGLFLLWNWRRIYRKDKIEREHNYFLDE